MFFNTRASRQLGRRRMPAQRGVEMRPVVVEVALEQARREQRDHCRRAFEPRQFLGQPHQRLVGAIAVDREIGALQPGRPFQPTSDRLVPVQTKAEHDRFADEQDRTPPRIDWPRRIADTVTASVEVIENPPAGEILPSVACRHIDPAEMRVGAAERFLGRGPAIDAAPAGGSQRVLSNDQAHHDRDRNQPALDGNLAAAAIGKPLVQPVADRPDQRQAEQDQRRHARPATRSAAGRATGTCAAGCGDRTSSGRRQPPAGSTPRRRRSQQDVHQQCGPGRSAGLARAQQTAPRGGSSRIALSSAMTLLPV